MHKPLTVVVAIHLYILLIISITSITGRSVSKQYGDGSGGDIMNALFPGTTTNGTYSGLVNYTVESSIGVSDIPQLVVYFGFYVPPNTTVTAGIYINNQQIGTLVEVENMAGEGSSYSEQVVLAPCELQPPNISLTVAILEYSSANGETGYIYGGFNPVPTQLFGPDGGLSGIQTAYCCETYFYFNLSDGNDYDVSILLETVNSYIFPFSTACIKRGSCPTNSNDSCIYWSAPEQDSTAFHIEAKKLQPGDYYVRLETPLFQTYYQDYNITATKSIHKQSPKDSQYWPYIIGGIVAAVVVSVLIIVALIYKQRKGYKPINP